MTSATRLAIGRARSSPLRVPAVVALVSRAAFGAWTTHQPYTFENPAVHDLRMAVEFASRSTPSFAGDHTALFAPGYALVLAPFGWVLGHLDLTGLHTVATVLNVLLATVIVVLGGVLAGRLLGQECASSAAWLLVLSPAGLYLTSVASGDLLFVALVLTVLAVATGVPRRGRLPGARELALGLLIGAATLVHPSGLMLLPSVAIALRPASSTWGRALTRTAAAGAVVVVVCAPWAVRNGLQVGVWSPLPTRLAADACLGHGDEAVARVRPESPDSRPDCFEARIFGPAGLGVVDDPADRDEDVWHRDTWRSGVDIDLATEAGLLFQKPVAALAASTDTFALTEDFGENDVTEPRVRRALDRLADGWLVAVAAFAALGLVLVPACRRAAGLWGTALLLLVPSVVTAAGVQSAQATVVLLAVLGAGFVGRVRDVDPDVGEDVPGP